MSPRETILEALRLVLVGIPGARVLRNEPLPGRIPAGGMVILRDGDPGQPEVTLSPLRYHYEHRAGIDVLIQKATGRDAAFDAREAEAPQVFAVVRKAHQVPVARHVQQ
jgi:hypothetical protein